MKRIRKRSNITASKASLQTPAGEIFFTLKISRARRTISISISSTAEVTVSAPSYASKETITSFIEEKSIWIRSRIEEAERKKNYMDAKRYADGEEFLFLGEKFPLKLEEREIKRAILKFEGNQWIVHIPKHLQSEERHDIVEKKMIEWYRLQAKEIVGGRIFHFSRILGNEPLRIEVRTHKRVWGNCDPRSKTIHINWQVILSPLKVIDYIVVHELCHLFVPNHSQRFWNKVEKILPDYKEQKKWLRLNTFEMLLPGQYA